MTVRVGINGFGRIGRSYLRAALRRQTALEVVAVNDVADTAALASLLEWDSTMGHLGGVGSEGNNILVADRRISAFSESAPDRIPWRDLGVDVVIESTGRFTDRKNAQRWTDPVL